MSKTHHAYPGSPEIETVMRLSAVKRWHMIDTFRIQNLAEHTANVALLAWVIAHTSPDMFFDSAETALCALTHDIGETFLGDIPTHSKALIGKEAIDLAERMVLPTLFKTLPVPSARTKLLVKVCDLADGIRFIRLHGVDETARHAQEGLEVQWEARWADMAKLWPKNVVCHVLTKATFYAYEEA